MMGAGRPLYRLSAARYHGSMDTELSRRAHAIGAARRRRWVHSAAPLLIGVILFSLAAGCGQGLQVEALRVAGNCHVWRVGPLSSVAVEVVGEQAYIRGRRRAYFEGPHQIVYLGDIGRVRATQGPPGVIVHGRTGDIVATINLRGAIVHGAIGRLSIEFSAACTDRQIALGVVSLIVVMSS
jgi:hypothetical protein